MDIRDNDRAQSVLEVKLNALYEINERWFKAFEEDEKIEIETIKIIIKTIVGLQEKDKHFLREIITFFKNDNLAIHHTLHVAIYAVAIAYSSDFEEEKIHAIGFAALLMDVGLKRVDRKIMDKKEKLDANDLDRIQQHPRYSAEILKHNGIYDPYIIDAVTHHHERHDGSGYPNALRGAKISDFASILAICDVFDAMTSNRPYRQTHTTFETLKEMLDASKEKKLFHEKYLKTLVALLAK